MVSQDLPGVLIIILNWNNAPDTIACINSLRKSNYNNHEILLIDNGSNDGSLQAIRTAFVDLKIIQNNTNLGVAGGRNVGIDFACRRIEKVSNDAPGFVLFIDNDIVIEKNCITEMVKVAVSDPRIGIVTSKILYQGSSQQIFAAGGMMKLSKGRNIVRGQQQRDEGQYDKVCDVDYGLGCSSLVKKELLWEVGKFDTIFGVYFDEDVDWSLRAKKIGYRVVYAPKAIMWHKVSHTTPGSNYWFQKARNHFIIMRRYASTTEWFIFIVSFPILLIKAIIYQIKKGNLVNFLHMIRGLFASPKLKS